MELMFAFDNSPKQQATGIRQARADGDSCVPNRGSGGEPCPLVTGARDVTCSTAHTCTHIHANVYMHRDRDSHPHSYAQTRVKYTGIPTSYSTSYP